MRPSWNCRRPDYLPAALKLSEAERQEIMTYGDALALTQFRTGIKGRTDAAREIADRLEGGARQPVEVGASEDMADLWDQLRAAN